MEIMNAQLFPESDTQQNFQQSFIFSANLPDVNSSEPININRCCGAAVSAPSERLGFYFGGFAGTADEQLQYNSVENGTGSPQNVSRDLLACDLSAPQGIGCREILPPSNVEARGQAEAIWIPTGPKGILLFLGGVQDANAGDYALWTTPNVTNDFMTRILLFDIDSETWYQQSTTGGRAGVQPEARIAFCAVVASDTGNATHHIYVYGGTYGVQYSSTDEVWVLSLPSFIWTLADSGNSQHRRSHHRCVKVFSTQMFLIGGRTDFGYYLESDTAFDSFDLDFLEWTGHYDPQSYYGQYQVPALIANNTSGNGDSSLVLFPDDIDPALKKLFQTPYKKTIPTWNPFATESIADQVLGKVLGLAQWLKIVLAIVVYLSIASFALSGVVILRRRQFYSAPGIVVPEIQSSQWLVKWMHNASTKELVKDDSQSTTKWRYNASTKKLEEFKPQKSQTTQHQPENDESLSQPLSLRYSDDDDIATSRRRDSLSSVSSMHDREVSLLHNDDSNIELRLIPT